MVPTHRIPLRSLLLVAVALICPGCGARRAERGQVEGIVQRAGLPLPNILVTFVPDAEVGPTAPRSSGVTDAKGHYSLRDENDAEGADVGPYRVIFEDLAVYSAPRSPDGTLLRQPPLRISPKLSDLLKTPVRKQIQQGSQTIDLDLTALP